MNKEDYYRLILERVKNPDFVTFTNEANEGEKRRLLSVLYPKIHVRGQSEPVSVFKCEVKYVHKAFKNVYKEAVKWAEGQKVKGLEVKVAQGELFRQSDFKRHLEALDGYHWNKNADYPSLSH
jgi:hypothetical protein